jgi:hypothetical protein
MSYQTQTDKHGDHYSQRMTTPFVVPPALCPDMVPGAATCSYCETDSKNHDGKLDDSRRRNILNALSCAELGLTEEEQTAMGRCLAYFDHFNKP